MIIGTTTETIGTGGRYLATNLAVSPNNGEENQLSAYVMRLFIHKIVHINPITKIGSIGAHEARVSSFINVHGWTTCFNNNGIRVCILLSLPVCVSTMIKDAPTVHAALTAEEAKLSSGVRARVLMDLIRCLKILLWSSEDSASTHKCAITLTASSGNAPAAVSPLNITASVPSNTAFATSVASALHFKPHITNSVFLPFPSLIWC